MRQLLNSAAQVLLYACMDFSGVCRWRSQCVDWSMLQANSSTRYIHKHGLQSLRYPIVSIVKWISTLLFVDNYEYNITGRGSMFICYNRCILILTKWLCQLWQLKFLTCIKIYLFRYFVFYVQIQTNSVSASMFCYKFNTYSFKINMNCSASHTFFFRRQQTIFTRCSTK